MAFWKNCGILAVSISLLLVLGFLFHALGREVREDVLNVWTYALIPTCCICGFIGKKMTVVAFVAIALAFIASFTYSSDMGGEFANGLAAGILLLSALASTPCTIIAAILGIVWRGWQSKSVQPGVQSEESKD